MAVRVREAVRADADAIAEIHIRAWQSAYRGQLPDPFLDALSLSERTGQWRRRLDEGHPTDRVIVVALDDEVVGFAVTGPSRDDDAEDDTGELMAINLHPDRWRSGLGTALMDEAVSALRSAGFARATLWVLDSNDRARSFYARLGWAPDGTRKTEERPEAVFREVRYVIDLEA